MKIKALTKKQLYKIMLKNKYVRLRFSASNGTLCYNCKIFLHGAPPASEIDNTSSPIISWAPISFMEYISGKATFM